MDKHECPKTISDIKALDKQMLVPADICGFLGCSAYSINCQAQADPAKLGYPVTVTGTRVRIPKEGFIAWAEGKNVDSILKVLEERLGAAGCIA